MTFWDQQRFESGERVARQNIAHVLELVLVNVKYGIINFGDNSKGVEFIR